MKKQNRMLDPQLDTPAVKILEQMKWVMGHPDYDMRVKSVREIDCVDYLPFANKQLAVIPQSAFRQPSGIQTDDGHSHVVLGEVGNVGEPICRPDSVLSCEVLVLEVAITFLALEQCLQVFLGRKQLVDVVLASNEIPNTLETHFLTISVDVVVSGDAEYPALWHTGRDANRVPEIHHQPVFICLSGENDVTSREDKIRRRAVATLSRDIFAHGLQNDVL